MKIWHDLRNSLYFYKLNKRIYTDGKFYCIGKKVQTVDF